MPHHIYQTKGFVLGNTPFGEADRLIHIFTEELGLVSAVAKSVRSEKSKLRYSLQDNSFSRLDLVRGREVWRVTDAEELARLSFSEERAIERIKVFVGVCVLLRRFVHGEEQDKNIFHVLSDVFFLLKNEVLSAEGLKNLEVLAALRILSVLGYAEEDPNAGKGFSHSVLKEFTPHRAKAVKQIHEAMQESHL